MITVERIVPDATVPHIPFGTHELTADVDETVRGRDAGPNDDLAFRQD